MWWSRANSAQDLPPSESLSAAERERGARFHRDRDRRRFFHRRAELRERLAAYLDADAAALEFALGPHGKPSIVGASVAFNLSHSDDDVVIAVTRLPSVGIDLQSHQLQTDVERMARQVFSPTELDAFAQLPDDEHFPAFFRIWTRKEAALKQWGDGLARDPRTLTVGLEPRAIGERWTPSDEPDLASLALETLDAPNGMSACVAAPREAWTSTRVVRSSTGG